MMNGWLDGHGSIYLLHDLPCDDLSGASLPATCHSLRELIQFHPPSRWVRDDRTQ
jgi:hypothetical protein